MAKKPYWYMRLKDNYFDSDKQKLLESMKNGYQYSNILLKLYLKSLNSNGRLMFSDRIPYDEKMLSTVTGHPVATIRNALKVFEDLDLIERLDSGAIYMLDIQNYIGKASEEADDKREQRRMIEAEKAGQMSDECQTKIDNTRVISTSKTRGESNTDILPPPTLDEVKDFFKSKYLAADPERFFNYHQAIGWTNANGVKIQDWQAAALLWEERRKNDPLFKEAPKPEYNFVRFVK